MSGRLHLALIALLCLALPLLAVTVDGTVTLQSETNHAGTRVLFTEASPSAVTDSAFTDGSGYFSLDLAIGIYVVEYSHAGFVTYTTDEIGLTTVTVLDSVMLFAEATALAGDLSGTLSAGDYWVVDNISVPAENQLVIEPGVHFYFTGNYSLSVYGALTAVGTATDSIRFTRYASGVDYWANIGLQNGITNRFEYCVFEYAGSCTIYNNSALELVHCSFRYNHNTIGGHGILACIDNCNFIQNASAHEGIIFIERAPDDGPCLITNSSFIGNSCEDFGTVSSMTFHNDDEIRIQNCIFRENTGMMASAVNIFDGQLTVIGCEFTENSSWTAGALLCSGDNNTIINCTFVGNAPCGAFVVEDATVINSCLFAYNNGYGLSFNSATGAEVTFCNFWQNTTGSVGAPEQGPLLLGQILTVNQNDDSSDVYYNISQDPMFVNQMAGDFHLLELSPCIDAGDTTLSDPDGTICDIGAYYYAQSEQVEPGLPIPESHALLSSYPNPFNPSTNISFVVEQAGSVELTVYDITGRMVAELVNDNMPAGAYATYWNATSSSGVILPTGSYWVQLNTPSQQATHRIVLIR